MRIFYGKGAYKRSNGNLPELKLINMFAEPSPSSEDGVVLISRKGFSPVRSAGDGPIHGIYREDGVFSGDLFTVSGSNLYRNSDDLGEIDGNGPVSFAGRDGEVLVTRGLSLWSYNGTDLAQVSFPDGASVRAVEFHDGLFLAIRDNTHKWYWSAVLNGRSWGALDFASAESRPDSLLDLKVANDTLYLLGKETIEPWANTGDTTPYQRFEQRIFSKGVKGTGCLVEMDNTILFIGSDNMVYRMADGPQRISDHGIEERIEASGSASCFGFVHEGHSFLAVRLNSGTWAVDLATSEWNELQTLGLSNALVQCATKPGDEPLFGSAVDGAIYSLDGWTDGAHALERRFTAGIPLNGGTLSVDVLCLQANTGWTGDLSGQGADPVVEMRSSRDAGGSWTGWRPVELGGQGEYRNRARWRRCGLFDEPGALFEFRVTDPVGFRVSAVSVNEQGGGRSR